MRKSGRVEAEGEDIVWKSKGKRGEREVGENEGKMRTVWRRRRSGDRILKTTKEFRTSPSNKLLPIYRNH